MTSSTVEDAARPTALGVLAAPQLLRERVYEALEAGIVDGSLPPGSHLREDDLAKQLGVSRNPVREALQQLMYEGLVDHRQGKGIFVHAPNLREVEEVFHVRALLESDSARLAAQNISTEGLEELERLLELGATAVREQNAQSLLELNERFHHAILTASDNSVMAKMMVTLQRRIRWYFARVVVNRSGGSWDQHEAIYRAIRAGDAQKAGELMAEHVRHTGLAIRDRITETE
jgi:DNA-binding GntR family transcriptional regulator